MPIRDWNYFLRNLLISRTKGLLSAYKGLKPIGSENTAITETCLLSAYKGLKPEAIAQKEDELFSLLSAYKGLKLGSDPAFQPLRIAFIKCL